MLESIRRRAWRLVFAAMVGAGAAQVHQGAAQPQQVSVVAGHAHETAIAMEVRP